MEAKLKAVQSELTKTRSTYYSHTEKVTNYMYNLTMYGIYQLKPFIQYTTILTTMLYEGAANHNNVLTQTSIKYLHILLKDEKIPYVPQFFAYNFFVGIFCYFFFN